MSNSRRQKGDVKFCSTGKQILGATVLIIPDDSVPVACVLV